MTASPGAEAVATCVLPARAQLGECPLWSVDEARLYWVDIDGRAVHRFDPATGIDQAVDVPGRPGSLALTSTAGELLVALEGRLGFLSFENGSWRDWVQLEPDGTGNRLNDGRCDPAGRFWVGSMFDPAATKRTTGSLYRVEPDGTTSVIRTEVGVPNATAFSPDGRTMYFADTHRDVVWAYAYDADTGEATDEQVFIDFTDLPGHPDGACVDEEGGFWVSCVFGSAVVRVTPDGRFDQRIDVPVLKPTMPAFGGPSMSTLFVTSIGGGGSHAVDPSQPEAGGIFAVETRYRGIPETPFGGAPA